MILVIFKYGYFVFVIDTVYWATISFPLQMIYERAGVRGITAITDVTERFRVAACMIQ